MRRRRRSERGQSFVELALTLPILLVLAYRQAQVPARALLANITGGRDSRLVLALMLSEGITDQFVFTTFGSPQLPDTIVATAIADRFGLDHRAATRPAPSESLASAVAAAMASEPVTYEQRIRDHLWVTSGLLSIWDLRGWSRTRSRL